MVQSLHCVCGSRLALERTGIKHAQDDHLSILRDQDGREP